MFKIIDKQRRVFDRKIDIFIIISDMELFEEYIRSDSSFFKINNMDNDIDINTYISLVKISYEKDPYHLMYITEDGLKSMKKFMRSVKIKKIKTN